MFVHAERQPHCAMKMLRGDCPTLPDRGHTCEVHRAATSQNRPNVNTVASYLEMEPQGAERTSKATTEDGHLDFFSEASEARHIPKAA